MRLAAQLRGGFYPAAPKAVAHAASFLRPPAGAQFAILDPCAGEGGAVRQLAALLGCPPAQTYAIELDEGRAEALRAALPEGRVLAPANFFGCRASFHGFSFVWLNPPFDHAYGGYRVEDQFLRQATDWLQPGGIMAFVCPEDVVGEYCDARRHFATYYDRVTVVPFPPAHRPFREVVVFGCKRSRPAGERPGSDAERSWPAIQAPRGFVYSIPPGSGPRLFQKAEPTEPELQRLLAQSPLRSHLTVPPATSLPTPPLALGIGHVALLLASGHLDGVIQQSGQSPQVVRGTSRKRSFVADVTETSNPDGTVTTRTTIAERIDLVVRTADLTGTIRTYRDGNAPDE